ncbi:GyrI-like domain-containing protein [Rhodohalobacter halophilus]|uniref:GyrI-like domain-containing protein n=1 Tax=Rhodohalobacter halophilus TaxID=1812810 RepID=UPI00083FD74D|nr:effector binding domain-containing protein [Rhodohalobacter halophilus]
MKVVTLPKITLIGIEVKAHWKELHQKMPEAWEKLFTRKGELSNRTTDTYTEISANVMDEIYTQIVGAEVEPGRPVPAGMTSLQIPKQSYLHFHHTGPLTEIAGSFGKMYRWAEENRIAADEFKIDRGYLPGLPDSPHDLYIKVVQ